MKKIEYLLRDYGIIVKICLAIVWVLWAIQLAGPLKSTYTKEMEYQKSRNFDTEQAGRREMLQLENKLEKEANLLGEKYGPKEYFAHLKVINKKARTSGIPEPMTLALTLQNKVYANVNKGKVTMEQIRAEAELHREWLDSKISKRDELPKLTWSKFTNWVSTFYLRTCLFVLFWFITSMADRKGILETILAEKAKFVYSIILWPVFFTRYPHNVLREIRVEAELRRLKGLFRVLSNKEVQQVREIANSSAYYLWLGQTRRYKRGLILALTVTLFLHLLCPSYAKAARGPTSKTTITSSINHSQQLHENNHKDGPQTSQSLAVLETQPEFEAFSLIRTVTFIEEIWQSRFRDALDVIPRNTLFGKLNQITNQIRKGITNEVLHMRITRSIKFNNQFCQG